LHPYDIFFFYYYRNKGFTIIPEWVNFLLDVSEPIEKIRKKFHKGAKDDLRKLKRYDYSYEISEEKYKKDFFYNNMFLPYVKKVDTTFSVSPLYYYKIYDLLRNCIILFIKDENKYVAGGAIKINKRNNKVAQLVCMGIINGNKVYVKKSAITALLYYHILWAKDNKIEILDFGHARPLLNDGLFRYKKKWGMNAKISDRIFCIFGFKILANNISTKSFISNNQFYSFSKNH
jgi:hypothetical protein